MNTPTPHYDPASDRDVSPRQSSPRGLVDQFKAAITFCLGQWDRFWFQPRDSYSLAVLRLLTGGMLFYSHLVWGLKLDAFFGSTGWNNAGVVRVLQSDSYAMSFWWYVPDTWLMPVHVVCCVILLMFFLGLLTRVSSVLSWVIAVSYAHRAMLANYGLDQIVCVLTLYLAISPCGQYLSLDAWWRRWFNGEPNRIRPSVMSNVACRLVQCHLCVMYFFAGTSKLQGRSWWNGDAVWETIANYEYQSTDLTFLAWLPFVTHLATHATVLWEVSFSALVWNRYLRPLVLMVGVMMHFGIGMFLGMWTFGTAMMFGYVTFIPSERLRVLIHGFAHLPAASIPVSNPPPREAYHPEVGPKSIDTPTTDGPSESGTSESLILVCQSYTDRVKTLRYFHGHGEQILVVDGMSQAYELCRCCCGTVVVLDAPLDDEARQHWTDKIAEVNPQMRFVFLMDGVQSPHMIGNAWILSRPSSLLAIRSAIESGAELMQKSPLDASANEEEYKKTIDAILSQQGELVDSRHRAASTPNTTR